MKLKQQVLFCHSRAPAFHPEEHQQRLAKLQRLIHTEAPTPSPVKCEQADAIVSADNASQCASRGQSPMSASRGVSPSPSLHLVLERQDYENFEARWYKL